VAPRFIPAISSATGLLRQYLLTAKNSEGHLVGVSAAIQTASVQ